MLAADREWCVPMHLTQQLRHQIRVRRRRRRWGSDAISAEGHRAAGCSACLVIKIVFSGEQIRLDHDYHSVTEV